MDTPAPPSTDFHTPVDVHLRDYLRILRKRKWAVLGVVASAVIGTALYVLMQPALYSSTVSLLVEPSGPNVMSAAVEEVYAPINVNIEYYKTQYEILKSHQVLREAVVGLNLKAHPEYSPKPLGPLESWFAEVKSMVESVVASLVTSSTGQEAVLPESEVERRLVESFKGHVEVKPVRNSRIVRVTVESTDPQLAAAAANTIASVYISRSLAMKIGATEQATRWTARRVEELCKKVEQSEERLHVYASRYGLVNVDARRRLGTQKLSELNAQLVRTETKRAEAEARFKQIASVVGSPGKMESSAEVLASALIQNLRTQEVQAAQKVAEQSEKYGPKHPAMVQARSEMAEVQAMLQNEIKKIYGSVKAEYQVALARERVIRSALSNQKAAVMDSGRHEVQYGILEREVKSNRQLYDVFLNRMKETVIVAEIQTGNIYVADPAIVSLVPVKPRKRLAVLLAAFLGLFSGVGLAFFLDYMDSTLKSPEDIPTYLPGVAYLGLLPVFSESRKSSGAVELVTHEAPQSAFAEHIRTIRTSLVLSAADKPPSSILVTSAVEEEGKSTFATNLAIALAQLGHPSVLIEGDLRKPNLHKIFGLKVTRGLSHYLAGKAGVQEIRQPTMVPNLQVIPCGAIPPNPAELLQSKHMKDLLEALEKEGAHVVVDSTPVLAVADPIILGHCVDGVILVIRAAHTAHQTASMAARTLREGGTKVLGVVLQRLSTRELSSYYSAYYPYSDKKYYGREPDVPMTKRS